VHPNLSVKIHSGIKLKRIIFSFITLLAVFLSVADSLAQIPEIKSALELVSFEASASPAVISPGGRTLVTIDASM